MATCGDDLCNGLKYVLEQGVQTASQKNQNQQNDNNNTNTYDHDDPEMAMSRPFSTEEASTAAAMSVASSGGGGGGGEKQETAPDAKSAAASLLSTITGGAVFQQQQQKARYGAGDIQATVLMISGCQDAQTSADVSNVSSFTLPDPNGRAGGACTSALLQVLYADHKVNTTTLTFAQVINSMRTNLSRQKFTQIPQLSSSKEMDIFHEDFYLVPPECTGTKRAVLIGINYFGQQGELTGCINDCLNMKDYIVNVWGFAEENITVLTDDDRNDARPTKANILAAYQKVAGQATSGDTIFCHYSGHGARLRDDDRGEEDDGYDETLVPVDYDSAGQIRDDDLYQNLVCALPAGVHLVALMDCCHSGSVLDLPFKYKAGGGSSMFGSGGGGGAQAIMQSSSGAKLCLCFMCCCCIGVILAIVLPLALLL